MNKSIDNIAAQPQLAVGAVIVDPQRGVLLVRRRNAPAEGLWAIPGGKQSRGETLQQAAEREVLEETGLHVKAGEIIHTFELLEHDENGDVRFHYVIIDVKAEYVSGILKAGDDALEARWFTAGQLDREQTSSPTLELLEEKFNFK